MMVVMAVNEERAQAVDYGPVLDTDKFTFLYYKPKVEADITGFIKPFDWDVRFSKKLIH